MLRLGNQIRLHKSDIDRIKQLTGVQLNNSYSVKEFNHFIEEQLNYHDEDTPESTLLRMMLAEEVLGV